MTDESQTTYTDLTDQLEMAIRCAFNANDMSNVAKLLQMKIDLLRVPVPVVQGRPVTSSGSGV